jgi:hypothetical protein
LTSIQNTIQYNSSTKLEKTKLEKTKLEKTKLETNKLEKQNTKPGLELKTWTWKL